MTKREIEAIRMLPPEYVSDHTMITTVRDASGSNPCVVVMHKDLAPLALYENGVELVEPGLLWLQPRNDLAS